MTSYPKDLRQLTDKQIIEIFNFYTKLSLKDLRKRQSINQKQGLIAFQQQNIQASSNIQIDDELLRSAIDFKEFGDVSIKDVVSSIKNLIKRLSENKKINVNQKLNEAINKVKSKTLKEQLSDYSKDTDEWFDDLATISENYFENGRSEPVLEDLLKLADWIDTKIRPSVKGVTLKQFELFKKEVSKLRHPLLKSLHKFLDDLTPMTYSDEYKYFSNDSGGNVSVVQGVMSLFNQAVNYYGDIDEYYENKLGENKSPKNLLKKITEAAEYVEPEVKAQIDDIIGTLRDENFYNKDARRKFVNHLHNLITLENESPEARKSVKKFVKYVSDAITEYELDIADDSDIVDEEPIEENVDSNAERMKNMRMKSEGKLEEQDFNIIDYVKKNKDSIYNWILDEFEQVTGQDVSDYYFMDYDRASGYYAVLLNSRNNEVIQFFFDIEQNLFSKIILSIDNNFIDNIDIESEKDFWKGLDYLFKKYVHGKYERKIISKFNENKNLKPEQKLDEALSKVKGYLKEKELTTAERNSLPDSAFVFPKERKYPIHDENHARDALAYVSQHGTSAEQAKVKSAVKSKYPQMEVK